MFSRACILISILGIVGCISSSKARVHNQDQVVQDELDRALRIQEVQDSKKDPYKVK